MTAELPEDVKTFLRSLERNYEAVFMTEHTSPCSACNGGKPRIVHRCPVSSRLGGELRRLVAAYKVE